ncbi:putative sulfate transporter [Talaromyces proteolyticus]|uniref:Sulfate transporter n=1 Tax=Talaromyces proteolyticus TaxID=1131652 RepID=A0AAD4KKR9_9EURO|nr:putative sulfate transporter [Talaromyces proteolyticus]KAH8694984.1 putative sulfate transporter [Talaromyces proteolyticus]
MSNRRLSEPEDPFSLPDRLSDVLSPRSSSSRPANDASTKQHSHEYTHEEAIEDGPDATTRLLGNYERRGSVCGQRECNHGTFSPRPEHYDPGLQGDVFSWGVRSPRFISSGIQTPTTDGTSNTPMLTAQIGAKRRRRMYLYYYIPFLNWVAQYRWDFFRGDLIAALTIASFYIPMALSLSSNLAHAPPINGLYSFVVNPLIYAILGSSPQLIVGPEAAGSLLVGTVVKATVESGHSDESDDIMHAQVVGTVTGLAGAFIFIAGLTRLGFLDNVLSRPFLRGFITAVGVVIFVDQLIPEMGLFEKAKTVNHSSTVEKFLFIIENGQYAHKLTTIVAFSSFGIIMVFRTLKKTLEKRFPQVVYFPDRLLVVVLSAVLTWYFGWDKQGLEILGAVKPGEGSETGLFQFRWPFHPRQMQHIRSSLGTSFVIALLGFFESSVAAKGLGDGARDGIKGAPVSANREMIALGVANIAGGCFMALPAFGGYGRSKVNASTGGRTQMSSIFLSIITFIVVVFFLKYLYYLPKAVLCAMISVVAYSLVEECPHDLRFFIRVRGWSELALMILIFLSTIFYSLTLGIALGCGLSLLRVIRHATKPRIQILGKLPGTPNQFENAELYPEKVEFIEGCLIVKIPEPLTFANTGDLKNRLRRLELYGTNRAHPALPRVRPAENDKNIIFDVHGVTSIDASGTQVLLEIVESYVDRRVRVFFCRLPSLNGSVFELFERSGIVEKCGGTRHFVSSVDEALRLTEIEDVVEEYQESHAADQVP